MPSLLESLIQAKKNHYAICAFNMHSLDMALPLVRAAQKEHVPLILQTSPKTVAMLGLENILALYHQLQSGAEIPLYLHLDHATDISLIKAALKAGYRSVMYDGSSLPLTQNIEQTKKIRDLASTYEAILEAELGHVGMGQTETIGLTDPEQVPLFIEKTQVDTLAVAIGTAHGPYTVLPKIDFDRLEKITSLTTIPLVLHGSSGTPVDALQKAVYLGIQKVNVATELKQPFAQALRDTLSGAPKDFDPRTILAPAWQAVEIAATQKLQQLAHPLSLR